ncbi:MAG: phosphoribosyltransferase [Planctomycetota bacterium]|jgi:predicted phosphoribosyltransferase
MSNVRIISDSSEPFEDRKDAGEQLARQLENFRGRNPVVLGIPRGGVVIACEIAAALEAELDIILSHKLGAPLNPEFAIGAVFEDGTHFVNTKAALYTGADESYIQREKANQLDQMAHKAERYRKVLPKLDLVGRVVIVTDDGVATGASMRAALWAIRKQNPESLVLALPVGPEDTVMSLSEIADETVCLTTPPDFMALSRFYLRFGQVEDEEVLEILASESARRSVR